MLKQDYEKKVMDENYSVKSSDRDIAAIPAEDHESMLEEMCKLNTRENKRKKF